MKSPRTEPGRLCQPRLGCWNVNSERRQEGDSESWHWTSGDTTQCKSLQSSYTGLTPFILHGVISWVEWDLVRAWRRFELVVELVRGEVAKMLERVACHHH